MNDNWFKLNFFVFATINRVYVIPFKTQSLEQFVSWQCYWALWRNRRSETNFRWRKRACPIWPHWCRSRKRYDVDVTSNIRPQTSQRVTRPLRIKHHPSPPPRRLHPLPTKTRWKKRTVVVTALAPVSVAWVEALVVAAVASRSQQVVSHQHRWTRVTPAVYRQWSHNRRVIIV